MACKLKSQARDSGAKGQCMHVDDSPHNCKWMLLISRLCAQPGWCADSKVANKEEMHIKE